MSHILSREINTRYILLSLLLQSTLHHRITAIMSRYADLASRAYWAEAGIAWSLDTAAFPAQRMLDRLRVRLLVTQILLSYAVMRYRQEYAEWRARQMPSVEFLRRVECTVGLLDEWLWVFDGAEA
jgi:hypothetical protein